MKKNIQFLFNVILKISLSLLLGFANSIAMIGSSVAEANDYTKKDPISAGRLMLPDLTEEDLKLLTSLASGDFLGIEHQKLMDISKSKYYAIDKMFGPYLLTSPPSAKDFIDHVEFKIGAGGSVVITEPETPEKDLLGRQHEFSNWNAKKIFVTESFLFIQVDNSSLPKSRQGFHNNSMVSSLVAIRMSDLINHLGSRRILSSVVPLAFKMTDIASIEFQSLEDKAVSHRSLSQLLKKEFKTGGYTLKDSSGREQFLPDIVPDIYSDISRVLVRGLSAANGYAVDLNDSISPALKFYINGLSQKIANLNKKANGALQSAVDTSLTKLSPGILDQIPAGESLSFVRKNIVTDYNAPAKGTFLTKLLRDNKFTAKEFSRAEEQYARDTELVYKDYLSSKGTKNITDSASQLSKEMDVPLPTPREVNQSQKTLKKIANLSNLATDKITEAMKTPLGNVVLTLAGISLGYGLYNYTSVGIWMANYGPGVIALFDAQVMFNAFRAITAVTLVLGSIVTAGYGLNKLINKITGKKRSLYRSIALLTKKYPPFLDSLTRIDKIGLNFLFPEYSYAIYAGAIPSKANGGLMSRWAMYRLAMGSFYKNLFRKHLPSVNVNYAIDNSHLFKKSILSQSKIVKGLKSFAIPSSIRENVLLGKTRFSEAFSVAKNELSAKRTEIRETLDNQAARNFEIQGLTKSMLIPDLAAAQGITSLELINKLSYSPDLIEGEKFISLSEADISNYLSDKKGSKISKIKSTLEAIEDQAGRSADKMIARVVHYVQKRQLLRELKKSEEVLRSTDQLKAIYYLTISEAHNEESISGRSLNQSQLQKIYDSSKVRVERISTLTGKIKAKEEQNLLKAIRFYQAQYRYIRKFQLRGIGIKLYTGLANVNESTLDYVIKKELPNDFLMERFMSAAEFHRITQEMGTSFFARSIPEMFDKHHALGLFKPDAVSALHNPLSNILMSPLEKTNYGGRSGPDFVDKEVIHSSFAYATSRQFLNSKRLRQMQVIDRSMVTEIYRELSNRFRSIGVSSLFIHMIIFGAFMPDIFITSMLLYFPILKVMSYVFSKILYATDAINFRSNRRSIIEKAESRYLEKWNLDEIILKHKSSLETKELVEKEFLKKMGLPLAEGKALLGLGNLDVYAAIEIQNIEQEYLKKTGVKTLDKLSKGQKINLKLQKLKFNRRFFKTASKVEFETIKKALDINHKSEVSKLEEAYLKEVNVKAFTELSSRQSRVLAKKKLYLEKTLKGHKRKLKRIRFVAGVNPQSIYAWNFILAGNLTYFFAERLGFESGVVEVVSHKVGELFGHSEWAFQLKDIQSYILEHPLETASAMALAAAAYKAKKVYSQYRERKKIVKRVVSNPRGSVFNASNCKSIFLRAN